jgi:hypothetical protein
MGSFTNTPQTVANDEFTDTIPNKLLLNPVIKRSDGDQASALHAAKRLRLPISNCKGFIATP